MHVFDSIKSHFVFSSCTGINGHYAKYMTNFFDNTELWLNLHNLSLLSDKLNKKSMYKQNSKDQNVITAFIVVENACERFCMM